jgi:hypothetical protein
VTTIILNDRLDTMQAGIDNIRRLLYADSIRDALVELRNIEIDISRLRQMADEPETEWNTPEEYCRESVEGLRSL